MASESPPAAPEAELGGGAALREEGPASRVSLMAPVTMVALQCVVYKAYLELVERTPPAVIGLVVVDAVIFALFALPTRQHMRELLVPTRVQSSWLLVAVAGGLLIALCQLGAEQFIHTLGEPLDPGLRIWFEERGSPAWLGVLQGVVFVPLIYEIGWRGYFQMELSRLFTPLQASLITALVSSTSAMYPQLLPFDLAIGIALSELRRRSSSLIPCIAASSFAGALQVFVFNSAP